MSLGMTLKRAWPVLLLAVALNGCARPANYAALSPRPAELEVSDSPPASGAARHPTVVSEARTAQIATLIARAKQGDAQFAQVLATQRKPIEAARSARAMSEEWIAAQRAWSIIESARGPSVEARSGLDALAIESRSDGDGVVEISRAHDVVEKIVAQQDAVLRALTTPLSQPDTTRH